MIDKQLLARIILGIAALIFAPMFVMPADDGYWNAFWKFWVVVFGFVLIMGPIIWAWETIK